MGAKMAKALEAEYQAIRDSWIPLKGETGFSLYQHYRDLIIRVLFDQAPVSGFKNVADTVAVAAARIKFFDQAYIDNFGLCLTLRIATPDLFEGQKEIIDKYVRPDPQNEGLSILLKEMSGFLALLLADIGEASTRQVVALTSQIFGVTGSQVSQNLSAKKKILANESEKLLDDLVLMGALYCALYFRRNSAANLTPLQSGHKRSANEFAKAEQALSTLNTKILEKFLPEVRSFVAAYPHSVVAAGLAEYGVNLDVPHNNIQDVFYILCAAAGSKFLPSHASLSPAESAASLVTCPNPV